MTILRVHDFTRTLQEMAPLELAEPWDNVGLLVGDPSAEVERVMTCLTVTPAVVSEAVSQRVSLIVTHHPVLFHPTQRLTTAEPQGRMLLDLIAAGISVYSAHTAYDNAPGGINEQLAAACGLKDVRPLRRGTSKAGASGPDSPAYTAPRQFKVVVFVPESHWEAVAAAMFDAGAGQIGQYRECSFRSLGTGTFFGLEGTQPAVGQKGRREEVAEYRLETLCHAERLPGVLEALRKAHPYEEPAYDVYPLWSPSPDRVAGRVGQLQPPRRLAELVGDLQQFLANPHVGVVGNPDRQVCRLAVACGAGGEFLSDALAAGCDALLTGEARFHTLLHAEASHVALILAGHYATERFAVERLAAQIAERFPSLTVWPSQQEREPLLRL